MKRINIFSIALLACLSVSLASRAQFYVNGKQGAYDKRSNTYLFSIQEDYFGKDYQATITLDTDSAWTELKIDGTNLEKGYSFKNIEANKTFALQAKRNNQTINAQITFTFLPIINLQGNFGYDFTNGNLSLLTPESATSTNTLLKSKWRGGSTNSEDKHKRNYKIKTLNEKGKSKDISLLGMREDNNWILDAGQIDLFRLRNRIATELWNDFATKPYYAQKEPKAKSGVAGKVVEVILNHEYVGIYSLTEAMDRKELKLKKYDEKKQIMRGQLWKTNNWDKTQFWDISPDYNNTQETWHGFETKYPDLENVNPTDYSLLYDAIYFVANSDDETFKNEVGKYFDLPVLIDYQILLEITKAFDNTGKNMYWAVYDKTEDKKLTIAVWDLDASMGQYYKDDEDLHPTLVQPDNDIELKNLFNIYSRLINNNVDNYNQKVIDRYWNLRNTYLDESNLTNRYRHYYQLLRESGAAKREEVRWNHDSDIGGYALNFKEEMDYIDTWIHERIAFLDKLYVHNHTGIKNIEQATQAGNVYNILGQKVKTSYPGIKIRNGKKFITHKQ